mmetsp:Transcript_39471/g.78572  ORF Transcript_39471/g.78572 Transcript_39471/m.78572 type:complete len:247 (-) Transcript_39471:28-768(-)
MDRRRHGDVCLVSDLLQNIRAVVGALANVQDRFLRLVDQTGRALDVGHVHHGRGVPRAPARLPEDRVGDLSLHRHDVLGQVDVARPGPARHRDPERLVDSPGQGIEVQAHVIPLRAGPRDLRRGALLEGVSAHGAGGHLAGEDDHRNSVGEGVLERGDEIRDARAARHDANAELTGGLGVGSRRMAAALFMRGRDELGVLPMQSVEKRQHGAAAVPKHSVNAMFDKHVVDDLPASHLPHGGDAVGA